MLLSGDKSYRIGTPFDYTSIYGYSKRKFPIIEVGSDSTVGHVKEEHVVGVPGEPSGACFYTRDLTRPRATKRFYSSPEALIIAFGGKMESVAPPEHEPVAKPVAKPRIKRKPSVSKAVVALGAKVAARIAKARAKPRTQVKPKAKAKAKAKPVKRRKQPFAY